MATPNIVELEAQLADAIGRLNSARAVGETTSRASVSHESTLVEVFSLQLQLTLLELLAVERSDLEARFVLHRQAIATSKEIAEHEKRLVVARKAIIDDKEIEAEEHSREQDVLASKLLRLAKR